MKYYATKHTVAVYRLRTTNPGGNWADITVDEGDKSGRISISSDLGDWSNYWGACGESFKQFLCGLDIHYTAGKMEASGWFDHDATIQEVKRLAKELKRDFNKEQRLDLAEEIKDLEGASRYDEYLIMLERSELVHKLWDHPELCKGIEPGFRVFWDRVWPHFIEVLQSEIAAEKAAAKQ